MDLILSALIISVGIVVAAVLSSLSKTKFQMKPRPVFAQATVVGKTEESESMQLTTTLFDDESEQAWNGKLNKLLGMREARLGFQNERMLAIQEEHRRLIEEEKAKMAAEGDAESKKPTLVK